MFTVEMLPAGHGDALWLEFGDSTKPRRVLIDGGTAPTYTQLRERMLALPGDSRHIDLLVVTHVDADHIEGALRLVYDSDLGVSFGDVWFNGWRHLPGADDTLGPTQGEMLSALLEGNAQAWNASFDAGPVVLPDAGPLPVVDLDGFRITVLSPGPQQLSRLRPAWAAEVRRAGLEPGIAKAALEKLTETKRLHALTLGDERVNVRELARSTSDPDRALANGSSIAFLAEWEGRSVLFGADAHPDVLGAGIGRLLVERGLESLRLDAFKLPHHGSAANLTADLLRLVRCRRYLVSTNGDVFHHPDVEAIARVIVNGGDDPALLFNYRSEQTQLWDDRRMMREYGYSVEYADPTSEGLAVEIA